MELYTESILISILSSAAVGEGLLHTNTSGTNLSWEFDDIVGVTHSPSSVPSSNKLSDRLQTSCRSKAFSASPLININTCKKLEWASKYVYHRNNIVANQQKLISE